MSGIFISYRRSDVSGYAHALYAQLTQRFGADQVFMDIDSLEPGTDFVEVIEKALDSASVVLVLIGRRWYQPERLQDPMDFVRLEISMALERRMRVIPLCFESTPMPKPEELPEAIRAITRRQAVDVSDLRFSYDVGRLIDFLASQPLQATQTLLPNKSIPKGAVRVESKDAQSTKIAENHECSALQMKTPKLPDIKAIGRSPSTHDEIRLPEDSKLWIKKSWKNQKARQEAARIFGVGICVAVFAAVAALNTVQPPYDPQLIATVLGVDIVFVFLIYALVIVRSTVKRIEDGRRAVTACRAGKWTEADEAARWLIAHGRQSLHAWAYGVLGTLYGREGNYAEAEDAFNRSAKLGLDEDWVRRNREINAGFLSASRTEDAVGAAAQEAQ